MDSLPQANCHRIHYRTLATPTLAESSLSVMSLGDKDQWGLSYRLHYRESCAPICAERTSWPTSWLLVVARLLSETCWLRIQWIDICGSMYQGREILFLNNYYIMLFYAIRTFMLPMILSNVLQSVWEHWKQLQCFRFNKDCLILTDPTMKFHFVILIAGFKSRQSTHSPLYTHHISLPSLHVFGDTDKVIQKGMYKIWL